MSKSYRIIIVDDEINSRNGIAKLLNTSNLNIVVDTFDNSLSAIEYLKNNQVDMMFTDIKMPFMNGLELSHIAKKLQPNIVIIVISAYGEFDFAREAIRAGVDDYLLKPVEPDKIIAFAKKLIASGDSLGEASVIPISQTSMEILGDLDCTALHEAVIQCIHLVENEYSNPLLSVDFISERIMLSSGYLSQLFKKETHYNLSKFIYAYRMIKAKELIISSNLKINTIAANCGFTNITHFTFAFKKYFGISASKLRDNLTTSDDSTGISL